MANKYKRSFLAPSATVETALYTVPPANTAIASSLRVTSANASSGTLTVKVYPQGGGTGYHILRNYVIPASSTMDVLSGIPLVLEATDVIKVTASVSSMDFYFSYLEVDRN